MTNPAMRHLLLYDGVCGLCNGIVQGVLRRDPAGEFGFASLQSGTARGLLAAKGKGMDRLDTFYLILDHGSATPTMLAKGAAASALLERLGWPRLARMLRLLPMPLVDWCYDRVAASRYRIFGRYDSCPLPTAEQRERFLDV